MRKIAVLIKTQIVFSMFLVMVSGACSVLDMTSTLPPPAIKTGTLTSTLVLPTTPTFASHPTATTVSQFNNQSDLLILQMKVGGGKTTFITINSFTGEIQNEIEAPQMEPTLNKVFLKDSILYQKRGRPGITIITLDGTKVIDKPFFMQDALCCISALQSPKNKDIIAWAECFIDPKNDGVCHNTLRVSTLDGKDMKIWKGPNVDNVYINVIELRHWTQDARYIYFSHYYPGAAVKDSGGSEYWRIDLTSGEVIPIVLQTKYYSDIAVSTDDSMLAYIGMDSNQPPKLIVRDLLTNRERSTTLGAAGDKANHLVWSPDGKLLAYFLTNRTMLMNVALLTPTSLGDQVPSSSAPVAWTSSGALFLNNRDGLWRLDISTSQIKKISDTYTYIVRK